MNPRNIVIFGFKACGKSTVGKALAGRLGSRFSDLDAAVEDEHRRGTGRAETCREIYRRCGKDYFRELERKVLEEIVRDGRGVISLGGGALMEAQDPRSLLKGSFCVYLRVEPEVLFARIMSGGMPAFFDPRDPRGSFEELSARRLPLYRRLAHITVDNTERPVEAVVEEIVAALNESTLSERMEG